jgi:hypothetical protein
LSAGWCDTYNDPQDQTNGLPPGTTTARILAIGSTTVALGLRFMSIWQKKQQFRLQGLSNCRQKNDDDENDDNNDYPPCLKRRQRQRQCRILGALCCLVLSHLCLVSCAVIPMSCGCLLDGEKWVSLSIRDDIHDYSLEFSYLGMIAAGFLAGYHRPPPRSLTTEEKKGRDCGNSKANTKQLMLYSTCVFAIMQSWGFTDVLYQQISNVFVCWFSRW